MKKGEVLTAKQTPGQTINGIAMGVGKQFFRFGMNYIMVIVNIIAIALMTLVSIGFQGWEFLWTSTFIITTIILFVIYISTHWALHNSRLKKLRIFEQNVEYMEEQEKKIKETTGTKEWVEHCGEFLAWRAIEKKKEAWKTHISNALVDLDKKYRKRRYQKQVAIDRREITDYERKHLSEEEIEKRQNEIDELKMSNPYTVRKRMYQEYLSDEWIARNIDNFNVDFDNVGRLFIENGATKKQQQKSQSSASYMKDNWQSRIVAFLMSGFITAFTVDLFMNIRDLQTWLVFAIRMINLILNIIMGTDYGDRFFIEYDVHNIRARVSITHEFRAWGLSRNIFTVAK